MDLDLAIDFGTYYSSAALPLDNRIVPVQDPLRHTAFLPSSIALAKDGSFLVGTAAENRRRLDSENYRRELKRLLGSTIPIPFGTQTLSPDTLIAEILRKLKNEAELMVSGPVQKATLTIPASYGPTGKRRMEDIARMAGFTEVRLLPEPVAAAIYIAEQGTAGQAMKPGETVLVYDLGGGTFDVALIRKEDHAYHLDGQPDGDPRCGGVHFDREILEDLLSHASADQQALFDASRTDATTLRARYESEDFCQNVKKMLTESEDWEDELFLPGVPSLHYHLDRARFNEMIAPRLRHTADVCDKVVKSSSVAWQDIDAILLVGGSTRVPLVRELLADRFGRPIRGVDQPELAVCFGAAWSRIAGNRLQVTATQSLGQAEEPAVSPDVSIGQGTSVPTGNLPGLPPVPADELAIREEVEGLLRRKDRAEAVARYRSITDCTLARALAVVNGWEAHLHLRPVQNTRISSGVSMFRGNAARTGEMPGPDPASDIEAIWIFKTNDAVRSSPAVAAGVVFVGSSDKNVYALDAVSGAERWRFTTGNYVWSSPAVAAGVVYIGSHDYNVHAVDAVSGAERWRFKTGREVRSSPAVAAGVVYVGSDNQRLYALDAATGAVRWHFTTGGWVNGVDSSPAAVDGVVYGGSVDKHVYAVSARTGKERWRFKTGGSVHSSPAVVGGIVYIGSEDKNLYALRADSGEERWRFATGGSVHSSPTVVGGVIYIGSSDGNLYALGARVARLEPGATARVITTTKLRAAPSPTGVERGELAAGAIVTITGKSVTAGEIAWWPVTISDSSLQSWADSATLEPVPKSIAGDHRSASV